jgi:hypothetical protein
MSATISAMEKLTAGDPGTRSVDVTGIAGKMVHSIGRGVLLASLADRIGR